MTVPKTQWAPGSGKPYFAPVGEMPDSDGGERAKRLRAIEELLEQAWLLGNRYETHTLEDLAKAAELWEQAACGYEELGARSYEAQCVRREATRCRDLIANAEPKKGTGTT